MEKKALTRDDLLNLGSLITYLEGGKERCVGDLIHFRGGGTYVPFFGQLDVTKAEADAAKENTMEKIAIMLTAAVFMLSTVTAYSEVTKAEKDECLLASKNCTGQAEDINTRMHKLNKEIAKGSKVYTPQELQKLKDKLQETDQLLKDMEEGSN